MKKLTLAVVAIAIISLAFGFGKKEEVATPETKTEIGKRIVATKDLSAFD